MFLAGNLQDRKGKEIFWQNGTSGSSRQLLQAFLGKPSPLAFGRFDAEPARRDDEDDDVRERGKCPEAGGGLERGGFQVGAGSFDAALEFVVLGVVKARGFVFALPDERLTNEFGAGFTAPGVGGLSGGFLQSLELIFDLFHFTFFNGAIGSVNDAVPRLLIKGVDFDASAGGVNGNDDV